MFFYFSILFISSVSFLYIFFALKSFVFTLVFLHFYIINICINLLAEVRVLNFVFPKCLKF